MVIVERMMSWQVRVHMRATSRLPACGQNSKDSLISTGKQQLHQDY